MKYTLRTLTSKDIFPVCKILKKIGVKEFKSAFNNPELIASLSSKQMSNDELVLAASLDTILDIVGIIITNLPACEKELYEFLMSVIKEDVKLPDLQEMPLPEFATLVKDVIGKDEFKDFFKVALGFFKSGK